MWLFFCLLRVQKIFSHAKSCAYYICAMKLGQKQTPFITALENYIKKDVSPFDVPGHHMGNIDNAATKVLGHQVFLCDVNAPVGMDNLAKPNGVIMEAEQLMAEACHADEAFFLINGTSSGIIAMIMTAVKAGEKIILPRNIHKSVISALTISGAVPVYVMPQIDNDLEIANQPTLEDWKKAINRNTSAKAIFVINPTYFGAVGELEELVEYAHEHHMAVLVDEAHGAHFYFHLEGQPMTAMDAGADMSSVSFHKTAGSLTQSSVLLLNEHLFRKEEVQTSLNILNTTSPSTLLMASLDGARAFMASKKGQTAMAETYKLIDYASKKINQIKGFEVRGKSYFKKNGAYDYDSSKVVIAIDKLDIDGFDLYRLLIDKYEIQVELAETYEIMCVFAIGTKKKHVDSLVEALKDISAHHYHKDIVYDDHHFDSSFPFMLARPRVAFHAPGKVLPLEELDGTISKEQVMMYPPGIPLIVPGEVWNKDLIKRVQFFEKHKKEGIRLLSSYKDGFEVIATEKWRRFSVYEKKLSDYNRTKKTTPLNDGYHVPFEGEKHKETLVLLPFRLDTWRKKAKPAQAAYKEVISAIAKHEKVVVGIHPRFHKELAPMYERIPNVETISVRYNDAWARDNMPLFLTNGKNLRTVDFRFNAWGGEYDGLYKNYKDDDKLRSVISKKMGLMSYVHPKFVLEGGSVALDGEGTLITTEACLLSPGRNPCLTKTEIEEVLREYLGVEKIVWIPHGIYEDETNEHIDNMVSFVKPGEVMLAWTTDKNDPQYDYCQKAYRALKKQTDAKGRPFVIHKMKLPAPLYLSKDVSKSLSKSNDTLDKREAGRRLAASYVNYYQGKDFIILPAFGVKEDEAALATMKKIYPNKEIHQVNTLEILYGGGNIHCITMQVPTEEENK